MRGIQEPLEETAAHACSTFIFKVEERTVGLYAGENSLMYGKR